MSIKVLSHVWEHSQLSGTELLMLLAIADNADDDGICWYSVKSLAAKARVSPRQAKRLINQIEESGELVVKRYLGRQKTATYVITLPGLPQCSIEEAEAIRKVRTSIKGDTRVRVLEEKGDTDDTFFAGKGDTDDTFYDEIDDDGEPEKVTSGAVKGDIHDTRSVIEPLVNTNTVNTVATANAVTTSLPAAPTNVGAANHRPPPKQLPQKPKATATEQPPKEPNPTQAILAAYVEVRGKNGINYGKEGAAAKKIAKDGFSPEQVQNCYRWLKGQKFWEYKPLSLHTIFKYLPEYQRVQEKEEQDRPYDWNKVSNLPILNKVEMSIEEITF